MNPTTAEGRVHFEDAERDPRHFAIQNISIPIDITL